MERNYLICMLIGQFVTKGQICTAENVRDYVDEALIKACFTPLGTEEGDNQLLEELIAECMMYVIGQKINRKQRRA